MKKGCSMSELDPMLHGRADTDTGAFYAGSDETVSMSGPTAGELLRSAREAAGIHLGALAASLKVPVKKLEALEQDRFDLLPDVVFVRALASSICRTLKVDPAQVLGRLPPLDTPKLSQQSASINAPFRSPGDGPGPSLWAQISRPAVLSGLVLLMGALVLIFLPAINPEAISGRPDANSASLKRENPIALPTAVVVAASTLVDRASPVTQALETLAVASAPAGVKGLSAALTAGAPPASVSAAAQTAATTPVLPMTNPTLAVSPQVNATPLPANAALQATPVGIVTFRAKGESWVEVTDAKGVVVLRRTLAAGEAAGATGALPLAAIVGRADATQVQVRGQAFDLNTVSRDNVARFEVK